MAKQAIVQAGRRRTQCESVQELRDLFQPWMTLPEGFGKGGYKRLFSASRTFWLFLWQVLDEDGACREVLRKFLAWLALEKQQTASSSTAAYCKARKRLREQDVRDVHQRVVQNIEGGEEAKVLWCGRRVRVIDGSSVSMADTPANQETYPQPKSQKEGCGFPVIRIVAIFSLATGVLQDVAKGALSVHERTLFRALWDLFEPGDVALADRGFTGYADFYYLAERGVDPVMRNHQRRNKGVRKVKRLGKNDHLVVWHKTPRHNRPKWMSKEQWEQMPDELTVRQLTVTVALAGFRTKSLVIVTTLLDPKAFPPSAIAQLYRRRWAIELYLRDLKTTMGMDVLRCKTPEMVNKELYMHLIAYNLVRAIMLQAATAYAVNIERLSVKGAIATIRQWAPILAQAPSGPQRPSTLHRWMLYYIADDALPHRPNRTEPRARKRRPKNYPLLNEPRRLFKEIPHRNRYRKGKS